MVMVSYFSKIDARRAACGSVVGTGRKDLPTQQLEIADAEWKGFEGGVKKPLNPKSLYSPQHEPYVVPARCAS